MKILLTAINAKYIHSNPAVYSLRAYAGEEAQQEIQIAVIGHYQSEQFTIELLKEIIERDCPGVKCTMTETNTNPIIYL